LILNKHRQKTEVRNNGCDSETWTRDGLLVSKKQTYRSLQNGNVVHITCNRMH